jgi:hypothetical protein
MKQTLVSRRDDLPTNFSIEKYRCTKDFTIADWVVNLEMRVLCNHVISSFAQTGDRSNYDPEAFVLRLLDKPIYSSLGMEENSGLLKWVELSHVRDATIIDLFCNDRENLGAEYAPYYEAYDRCVGLPGLSNNSDEEMIRLPIWRMYESLNIDDDNNVLVTIDLHGSEEKTVADFTKWLRQIRKDKGIVAPKRRWNSSDFEKWSTLGVLPYLDLTNWAMANRKTVTQQVMGISLFPANYDVALGERVRKSVAVLARQIEKSMPGKFDNIIAPDGKWLPRDPDE